MSHELRTPLNSLLILSRLLMDNEAGNLTDKQTQFACTIHDSGKDLLDLINEILDLSKIESGKVQIVIEKAEVREILAAVEGQFRTVAEKKNLAFPISIAGAVPEIIETDPQRLGQVLRNLLSNAFKFTEQGSVGVSVAPAVAEDLPTGSGLDAGQCVTIRVEDTGIGIPQEKQKIIFEAFQQADGTTDRKYGGTGLGLSISRELVRLFGGEITLTSTEGRGSCFAVILPVRASGVISEQDRSVRVESAREAPAAGAKGASETDRPSPSEEGRGPDSVPDDRGDIQPADKTVLIIEDDPAFARILVDLSREKGFKCLVAEDGESGLHLADYHVPSAAMVDIVLPGIDGLTVVSRLKENLKTRHIPVHLVSGIEKEVRALDLGATGFLKKPVAMETLNEAFRRVEHFASDDVRKLLVVEDNAAARESIVELLNDSGLEITTVDSGSEAIKLLGEQSFDCMILDLDLPDMQGVELLRRVRNTESRDQLPVVVFTGKELSAQEKAVVDDLAQRIIVKGERSAERLVDETTLFLHRVEKDLPESQRHMIRMIHDKETILQGRRLLLVDDDMRNLFALGSILEAKGLQLQMATNGRHCLEVLAEHAETELVLMDVMMPEMDGYEAIRQIRIQEQFRDLPIIALTAKAMKGDRAKCIEAGASDYLAKPVDADKLLSMLRVWLYPSRNREKLQAHAGT